MSVMILGHGIRSDPPSAFRVTLGQQRYCRGNSSADVYWTTPQVKVTGCNCVQCGNNAATSAMLPIRPKIIGVFFLWVALPRRNENNASGITMKAPIRCTVVEDHHSDRVGAKMMTTGLMAQCIAHNNDAVMP